jgi:Ser/Thr protein kinase RdoA (MazF antagonist)
MNRQVLERILQTYGLTWTAIGEPQKGYRNTAFRIDLETGTAANLILYKREADIVATISRANRTSDFLAAAGMPTRRTLGRILRLQAGNQTRYCALYTYLPGHTIPWEAYTMDHLKTLGLAMSTMHHQLVSFPADHSPKVVDVCLDSINDMEAYFSAPDVQTAIHTKLGLVITPAWQHLRALLLVCDRLHGQQQLHMDLVRGNILYRQAQPQDELRVGQVAISGIIDFEKAGKGHPIIDIARTLAFLLVDCKYKSARQIRKYFLHSGYHKRGPTPLPLPAFRRPGATQDLLDELVELFLLYDLYKFLRHNPYESLEHNEHFVRTKEILLKRKIIARI